MRSRGTCFSPAPPRRFPGDGTPRAGLSTTRHRRLKSSAHPRFRKPRRLLATLRPSLCRRSPRTHAPAPRANSGCRSAFHAASSHSRKRSSLRRRTSSLAVSSRNALRPRGPTSKSISRSKSFGISMCARCVPFICAYQVCHPHSPQSSDHRSAAVPAAVRPAPAEGGSHACATYVSPLLEIRTSPTRLHGYGRGGQASSSTNGAGGYEAANLLVSP
jgi:hypothetical protein